MPSLPDRPNLEQLKKQAKSLLRDARDGDAAALARFGALPAFTGRSVSELAAIDLALHDAQSVVAREYGFPSWNAMREDIDARALSFEAAVDEFVRCATGGAKTRAEQLLAIHPGIATASLQTALVLGDVHVVETRLSARPDLVTAPGGVQQWAPLLYACHTCMSPSPDALTTIATWLCAHGANPNSEYHWNWHPELPRTVLWAALCTIRHLPLAEALLEAGANPTDGVSAHIAGGGGDLAALDLLARFGFKVDGISGGVPPDGIQRGVPPLVYMMTWATDPAGPRWLLEHGADPNLSWGDEGEAPLHVAARRWDVSMAKLLVDHGADPRRRRADARTPHMLAELHGHRDIAAWLLAHGAVDELTPLDRFAAACGRSDRAAADAMLSAQPSLRSSLTPEHHRMLHGPAETGNAAALEAMLACGFEADARDKDQVTPLQRAAMGGHPDAVRVLLAHGASVHALDGMFAAPPLVWAVEGRSHTKDRDAGFVEVARLLIAAGSPLEWTVPEGAPNPERTQEGLIELRRAAAEP